MPLRRIHWRGDAVRAIVYLAVIPAIVVGLLAWTAFDRHRQDSRNRAQVAVNTENIKRLDAALAEVCHANTIALGVISTMIYYVQTGDHPNGYRAQKAIETLVGYAGDIGHFPACREINRP